MTCQHFGSWNLALAAAEPIKPFYNRLWNTQLIIKSIKQLHENKHELTVQSIWRDRSRKATKALFESYGKMTTGSALHDAARRYFGSWDRALSKHGIQVNPIRKKEFYWRKDAVARILRVLHEFEVPINATSIPRDSSNETCEIIYNYTGKVEQGSNIYKLGYKKIGHWDNVLKYAGFKISQARRSGSPYEKKHECVIELIRLFNKHEYGLNRSAITRYSRFLGAPSKSSKALMEERDSANKLSIAVSALVSDDRELTEKIFDASLRIHHYDDQGDLIKHVV